MTFKSKDHIKSHREKPINTSYQCELLFTFIPWHGFNINMLIIYLVLGTKFNRFNTISKIHPNAFWQHVEVSSMNVFPILTANSTFQSETSFTIENITSEEIKFKVRFSNDTNFSSKPIIGNIPAKSKETVKGEAFWIIMNHYQTITLLIFCMYSHVLLPRKKN